MRMFYRLYCERNKPNLFATREALLQDLDDHHAQWNLQADIFPSFEPKFGDLWLSKDSSLVDFVDDGHATGGLGLLVSEKALEILQLLKLPPNRAYPQRTTQHDKKITALYYWLQMLSVDYSSWIDFSRSEFRLKSRFEMDDFEKGEIVQFTNINAVRDIVDKLGENDQDLLFSRLVLNERYHDEGYDIFWLERLGGVSDSVPIVSERFKQTLERNKLVGYNLKEIPIELSKATNH